MKLLCLVVLGSLLPTIDAQQVVSRICLADGKPYKAGERLRFGKGICVCKPPDIVCGRKKKDPCASSPCQNGGSCLEKKRGFLCKCPFPYEGSVCDVCPLALPRVCLEFLVHVSSIPQRLKLRCFAKNATTIRRSLPDDSRFSDNMKGRLSIRQPRAEDSGVYTCTASNKCGVTRSKIQMTFRSECRTLKLPPKVVVVAVVTGVCSQKIGARVYFKCSGDNKMYGSPSTECGEDGKWTEDPPYCLPPDYSCPTPKKPRNGIVITKKKVFKQGDRVEYDCEENFNNVGNSYQVCEGEGTLKWSKPGPKCKAQLQNDEVTCGFPGDINNGALLIESPSGNSLIKGTYVRYNCDEGYDLLGSSIIECEKNGQWSDSPPICYPSVVESKDLLSVTNLPSPCPCVNLTFVLDSSSSIRNKDFVLSLDLVASLATAFANCSDVRVSLIVYCNQSYLEFKSVPLGLLNDNLLQVTRCQGSTATRLALDMVKNEILPSVSCLAPCDSEGPIPTGSGYFPDYDPFYEYPCPCFDLKETCESCKQLLFLITDGQSNWAGKPFDAAHCLQEHGEEIFPIGIGPNVDVEELIEMASEPKHKHVLLATNYKKSVRLLNALKQRSKK